MGEILLKKVQEGEEIFGTFPASSEGNPGQKKEVVRQEKEFGKK